MRFVYVIKEIGLNRTHERRTWREAVKLISVLLAEGRLGAVRRQEII